MKKLLTLALALVTLAVLSSAGLTQQRSGTKGAAPAKISPTVILKSARTEFNWPQPLGKQRADVIASLKEQQLTTKVIGDGPQSVIVIYGSDGKCRACIGKPADCQAACSVKYSDFSNN